MRATYAILLCAALLVGGEAPAEDLPVFVLAGQSNMAGGGVVEGLPAEPKGPQTEARLVRFWETDFKPLDPAKLGKSFGPEMTFAAAMLKWSPIR